MKSYIISNDCWIFVTVRSLRFCLQELAQIVTALFKGGLYTFRKTWNHKSLIRHCWTTIAGVENNVFCHFLPFTLLTLHEWMAVKYEDIEGPVDTLSFGFMIPFDYWSPQIPSDLEATISASVSSSRMRGKLSVWVTPRQISQQWTRPYTPCHLLRVSECKMSH